MSPEPNNKKVPTEHSANGMQKLLHTLAQSGDKYVQFGILVLVTLSGIGNWFATQSTGNQNLQGQDRIRDEMRQKLDEIHRWVKSDLHEEVSGFESRQRSALDKLRLGLDQQSVMLANQQQMLQNQQQMLRELHKQNQ
jgi:hypothetical protein